MFFIHIYAGYLYITCNNLKAADSGIDTFITFAAAKRTWGGTKAL